MQPEVVEIKREHFHLSDPSIYFLEGILPADCRVEAYLDGTMVQAETAVPDQSDGAGRKTVQTIVTIQFPAPLSAYRKLKVFYFVDGKKYKWYVAKTKELIKKQGKPNYFIEDIYINRNEKLCNINGWEIFAEPVEISVYDRKGDKIDCGIQRVRRDDVKSFYLEAPDIEGKFGFNIEIKRISPRITVEFCAENAKSTYIIRTGRLSRLIQKIQKLWKKGLCTLKLYGIKKGIAKVRKKIAAMRRKPQPYGAWIKKHLPSQKELEQQRKTVFKKNPLFSVIVPLYQTPKEYLSELIRSVQEQTYANWELCFSDGSGKNSKLVEFLKKYSEADTRIKVVRHQSPLKIAENTNAALGIAQGDFLVFADHDDRLTPDALYQCAKTVNENPDAEFLYSDEDKMFMTGHSYFEPHMKPDFNIDLLRTVNYICHLTVVKKELQEKVGLFDPEYDGAQDYDFILRCVEKTTHIYHIPRVLYHWRSHVNSTAENPESKRYAFEAGKRAVQAHYDRLGIPAQVSVGEFPGLYRTRYIRNRDPLISILIPNKDHIDDLERCLSSIDQNSTYRNYEYIIIENNSTNEETFAFYRKLEAENSRAKVVYWKGEFNYSAINNFGEKYANGEYLLLLNNDTEIINADCLEELLGYCMRKDVGAVGARLYYEDDTIQHAGVVVGFGGIAGHCFVQKKRSETGYCHRIICAQDYSAVTAACMMVKRSAFRQVDGLSEELKVAFNDIDFCMKLRKAGYLIVYNPYAELYHYESKSRGLEDTPEKVARFNREIETFAKKWPEILKQGDPYYNPNLTLDSQDFSLKRI